MPRGVPGPVKKANQPRGLLVEVGGDKLRKKAAAKPRGKPFVKGHKLGGRPKGSLNKFSGEVKQIILDGLNSSHPGGLAHWVKMLGEANPTSAAALLGRLIPVNMEVKGDHTHTVTIKFE